MFGKKDVDAVWQVLVCLTEHNVEGDGEQCGGQNASLLDTVGDGEAVQQKSIVFYLTLMELAEDVETFVGTAKARQDFPQSITADGIKGIGQVMFCSLHFSCVCLSTKIMSTVPLLDLNPHWLSAVFLCAVVGMRPFSEKRAEILPAMDSRVMPL